MSKQQSKTVGLALSGGGVRGYAHIGVIHALQEAGVRVDAVAGSSAGAIAGAFLASGDLEVLANNLNRGRFRSPMEYLDPTLSRSGFLKGLKMEKVLRKMLSHQCIEDLPIAYTAVAADLETGKEVWLQKGNLVQAIRASMAIPMVFTPVVKEAQILVDGALINPLPVNVLRQSRLDVVIGVDLNANYLKERLSEQKVHHENPIKKGWFFRKRTKVSFSYIAESSLLIAQNEITENNLHRYPPDVLIQPKLGYAHLFDFHRAQELIDEGYRQTKAHLPEILKRIA